MKFPARPARVTRNHAWFYFARRLPLPVVRVRTQIGPYLLSGRSKGFDPVAGFVGARIASSRQLSKSTISPVRATFEHGRRNLSSIGGVPRTLTILTPLLLNYAVISMMRMAITFSVCFDWTQQFAAGFHQSSSSSSSSSFFKCLLLIGLSNSLRVTSSRTPWPCSPISCDHSARTWASMVAVVFFTSQVTW